VDALKRAIEQELRCTVETRDVTQGKEMRDSLPILRLIQSLGPMVLPIITAGDEIVSVGSPSPEEAVKVLRPKVGV